MVTALRHANTKVFNTSHVQAGTMSPSLLAVVAGTKYWNNEGASACQEHYAQLRSKRHGHNLTGASGLIRAFLRASTRRHAVRYLYVSPSNRSRRRSLYTLAQSFRRRQSFELDGVQVHVARNTFAKCRTIERARVSTSDLRLPL